MKVMLSRDAVNRLVAFIGEDWVGAQCRKFLENPNEARHPFIHDLFCLNNSENEFLRAVPGEIYYQQCLYPFLKYSYVGRELPWLESRLGRVSPIVDKLRNPKSFDNTLFELICMVMLREHGLKVERIQEQADRRTPDILVDSGSERFTVEATRRNLVADIGLEGPPAGEFLSKLMEQLEESGHSVQLGVRLFAPSTYRRDREKLLTLVLGVVGDRKEGVSMFGAGTVQVYLRKYSQTLYPSFGDLFLRYPSLEARKYNLGYSIEYQSAVYVPGIRQVCEVAAGYQDGLERAVVNTAQRKIERAQALDGLRRAIYVQVPLVLERHNEADWNEIKNMTKILMGAYAEVIKVVFCVEHFDRNAENEIDWWHEEIEVLNG